MKFWQGKRVLITGHTGFKGSWLSLCLQYLKAEVIGFALPPPTTPNLFTVASVTDQMTSVIGDIRDLVLLQRTLHEFQPEIIIHMAAQSLVRYSYQHPVDTFSTNVMGTVHLLEAIRQMDTVKVVINVTTDKCYENKEWLWGYRETDRLGGYDPYSNSKACSELVTSAYQKSYFNERLIGVASARAGNVIGGGDWAEDRLIPDVIRSCLNQQTVNIRYPNAFRPWQHVMEPLSGYLLLAEKLYTLPSNYSEAWNFGPNEDETRSVGWVADYVSKRIGGNIHLEQASSQHPHEAMYLKLDCSKAKSKLGWQPCWTIEKGLEETINWYRAFQEKKCMQEVTFTQIDRFFNCTVKQREPYHDREAIHSCAVW